MAKLFDFRTREIYGLRIMEFSLGDFRLNHRHVLPKILRFII